jgi:hypothetical protein
VPSITAAASLGSDQLLSLSFWHTPGSTYNWIVSAGLKSYLTGATDGSLVLRSANDWVANINHVSFSLGSYRQDNVFAGSVGFLGNSAGSTGAVTATITDLGSNAAVNVPLWLQWDVSDPRSHLNLRLGFNTTTKVYNAIALGYIGSRQAISGNAHLGVFNINAHIDGVLNLRSSNNFSVQVTNFQAGIGQSMSPGISATGAITFAVPDSGNIGLITVAADANKFSTAQSFSWNAVDLPSALLFGVKSMFSISGGLHWSLIGGSGYTYQSATLVCYCIILL